MQFKDLKKVITEEVKKQLKESKRIHIPFSIQKQIEDIVPIIYEKILELKKEPIDSLKNKLIPTDFIIKDKVYSTDVPVNAFIVFEYINNLSKARHFKDDIGNNQIVDFIAINIKNIKNEEDLKNNILHEYIHSIDPESFLEKGEEIKQEKPFEEMSEKELEDLKKKYFNLKYEFNAYSSLMLNALYYNMFKISQTGDADLIKMALAGLDNIIEYFKQPAKNKLNNNAKDLLRGILKKENKIIRTANDLLIKFELKKDKFKDQDTLRDIVSPMLLIKKYSYDNYKKFLNKLVSTYYEIKKNIK